MGGSLSSPVGLSFDDEFVAGGHESFDGGLGEQRVAHQTDPLRGVRFEGQDRRVLLVAFHDEFISALLKTFVEALMAADADAVCGATYLPGSQR